MIPRSVERLVEGILHNQPLNKWNVSNVRRMRRMFNHANSFNQPLNNWNVSRVTNMGAKFAGGMFNGASSFNQPLHAPWYEDTGDY